MSEQSNPVVSRLRSHILQMAPHQVGCMKKDSGGSDNK